MGTKRLGMAFLAGCAIFLCGCETMGGGSEIDRAVYATHNTVQKLDKNLGSTVTKLNETATELSARVDASNAQMEKMASVIEENQRTIDALQGKVDQLTATLYGQLGLSTSPPPVQRSSPPSDVSVKGDAITVVPPSAPGGEPPVGETTPAVAPAPPAAQGDPAADYQAIQKLISQKKYEAAVTDLDAYLQRYPNSEYCSNAQFWKARCYHWLNRVEEAIAEYEKVRVNYPNCNKVPPSLKGEAYLYLQLGQKAKGQALLQELIQKFPNDAASVGVKEALEKLSAN